MDMVDLSCLVDVDSNYRQRPRMKLSFVFGRKDRRVIEFIMESKEECDELMYILQAIAVANKAGKLNETVSALFKCLNCDAVFAYEDHRFEGTQVSCVQCFSNQVVEFFVSATGDEADDVFNENAVVGNSSSGTHHDASGKMRPLSVASGVSTVVSTSSINQYMAYGDIAAGETVDEDNHLFDVRTVDHNKKLVLDLQHFGDGEKCLGGMGVSAYVPNVGVMNAFVVVSTRCIHIFETRPDEEDAAGRSAVLVPITSRYKKSKAFCVCVYIVQSVPNSVLP